MKKILIIGLGFMGGSLAKSLGKLERVEEIWGFDENTTALNEAKNSDIIKGIADLDEKLADFDLVALCCPLLAYEDILESLSLALISSKKKPIIIDFGSLKEFVLKSIPDNLKENFVACHPIAGSDKSGFKNSIDDLFFGKKFVICKSNENSLEIISQIENFAKKIGCEVEFLDAKNHDEIYGLVSHLPQFLSFLTKNFLPQNLDTNFLQKSFRLNNSNPQIWGDIFDLNDKNIEEFYVEFFDNLQEFSQKLNDDNFEEILLEIRNLAKNLEFIEEIDEEILKNTEIDKILFRFFIAASFLKIKKLKNLLKYAGSGFKDFTLILNMVKLDDNILLNLFEENQDKILDYIIEISG